jgi:hypothetical protein
MPIATTFISLAPLPYLFLTASSLPVSWGMTQELHMEDEDLLY